MNTKMNFDMYVPTHTLFGAGMLNHLHSQKMPEKKALLIISNGKSTKINGYLKRTEEQLQKAGVEFTIFDQIEANPLKRSWHCCFPDTLLFSVRSVCFSCFQIEKLIDSVNTCHR